MRLVQWMEPRTVARQRQVGILLEENGREVAVSVTSVRPQFRTTLDLLRQDERRRLKIQHQIQSASSRAVRREWNELLGAPVGGKKPFLLPPIDVPSNPYAFSLWGAGVTHLRSAKAREEEARAVSGRPASFYDLMYEEGLRGGKPKKPPGSRPEIFSKADGYYTVGPNGAVRIAPTAKRCVPEPEVVSYYMAPREKGGPRPLYIYGEALGPKTGGWTRIGYTLGNDFSDQGWESENPLYLPHAKVQWGLAAIGPVFVTVDDPLFDPHEVAIRCRVLRGKDVLQDSGALRTGEKHMAHSLKNLEFHLFDNRPLRPGEIRGLYWGTSAVFKIPVKSGDRIEIEASSGLGVLRNPVKGA